MHWGPPEPVINRQPICLLCSSSNSLQPCGLWPARLLSPWDFPGKNPGVGSPSLLQGIFPTQELNLSLLHCRKIFVIHSLNTVYVSISVSTFIPWYPYICSLCLCLYFCFVNKDHLYHFARFHIHALIYGICFSLSDSLHSV